MIQNYLRIYNQSQIGVKEGKEYHIYIFENDVLIGALSTSLGWDNVTYDALFYSNIDILKALHNEAITYYKDIAVGYQFSSHIEQDINDFISIGFQTLGTFNDFPKGYQKHFFILKEPIVLPCQTYKVITSEVKIEEHDLIQQERINEYKTRYHINDQKVEFNYVALDNEEFCGGVYSFFKEDYIYISLLLVMEKHRGKNLGTKLMKKVEEQASILGTNNLYVGTASFQALDFYKKLGYSVVMTQEDYPKGHKVYTLYKQINIDK